MVFVDTNHHPLAGTATLAGADKGVLEARKLLGHLWDGGFAVWRPSGLGHREGGSLEPERGACCALGLVTAALKSLQ